MEIKEFEKYLSNVSDIHENMDEKMDYVKWFHTFNKFQQQAMVEAYDLILYMYKKELNSLDKSDLKNKERIDCIQRMIDIAHEQIVWIIEFKGMGATGCQKDLVAYEKPMYQAFENIISEKDIEMFKYCTIRYFAKFH